MRLFGNLCIAVSVAMFVAFATKPADQDIQIRVVEHYTGGSGVVVNLITISGVSDVVIDIRDYWCYKAIYNRVNGALIGYAFFTTVKFVS